MSGRRADLDTAKGFGMLLVILGHATPPEPLKTLVYGFHMPLFFIISGILWSGKVDFLKSARSLMVPFVIASVLSWFLWMGKQQWQASDSIPLWGPLIATLYGGDIHGYLVHNAPLWFLPAMCSLLGCLGLLRHRLSSRSALAVLCLAGGFALLASTQGVLELARLPMSLAQGLVGGVFFAFGHSLQGRHVTSRVWRLWAAVLASLGYAVLAMWNGRVDLFSMHFGQPVVYLLSGAIGAWVVITICQQPYVQVSTLQLLGRHSLLILASHLPALWLTRAGLLGLKFQPYWYLLLPITTLFFVTVLMLLERRAASHRHLQTPAK